MTPGPGIEPGTHWWKASALTIAPSLLPWRALIRLIFMYMSYLRSESEINGGIFIKTKRPHTKSYNNTNQVVTR